MVSPETTADQPRRFDAADWRELLARYGYPADFFERDPAQPSPPRQLLLFDIGPCRAARRQRRSANTTRHRR